MGNDIGGVALRLATLFPERVERLTLLNAVCDDSWPVTPMVRPGDPSNNHDESAGSLVSQLRSAEKQQGFAPTPPTAVLDGLFAPYTTEVGGRSLVRLASALNTNQTTELIALLPRSPRRP